MFLHLTPKFFTDPMGRPRCELVRLDVPELCVSLRGGVDFQTVQPYSNKRYRVASPLGRKHCSGLLLEVGQIPSRLSYEAVWSVEAERLVTHKVVIDVSDQDLEIVTDSLPVPAMHLGRAPAIPEGLSLATAQPRMDFDSEAAQKRGAVDYVEEGLVLRREERLTVSSVSPSTFSGSWISKALPALRQAIKVQGR